MYSQRHCCSNSTSLVAIIAIIEDVKTPAAFSLHYGSIFHTVVFFANCKQMCELEPYNTHILATKEGDVDIEGYVHWLQHIVI